MRNGRGEKYTNTLTEMYLILINKFLPLLALQIISYSAACWLSLQDKLEDLSGGRDLCEAFL